MTNLHHSILMADYTKAVTYIDAYDENTTLEFQENCGSGTFTLSFNDPEGERLALEVTLNHAQLLDLRGRIDVIVNKVNANIGQPGAIMERSNNPPTEKSDD